MILTEGWQEGCGGDLVAGHGGVGGGSDPWPVPGYLVFIFSAGYTL